MPEETATAKLLVVDVNIGYLRLHELAKRASGATSEFALASVAARSSEQAADAYFNALSAYYAQFLITHWRKRLELFGALLRFISERQTFEGLVGPFLSGLCTATAVVGRREALDGFALWRGLAPRDGRGEVWMCDGDNQTMLFLVPARVHMLINELQTQHQLERAADEVRRRALQRLIERSGPPLPSGLGIEGIGGSGIGGIGGTGFGGIDTGGPLGMGDPFNAIGDAIGGLLGGRRRRGGPIWSAEGLLGLPRSGQDDDEAVDDAGFRPDSPVKNQTEPLGGQGIQSTPDPVKAGVISNSPESDRQMKTSVGPYASGNIISDWWSSRSDSQKQTIVENTVTHAFQTAGIGAAIHVGASVGLIVAFAGTTGSAGTAAPPAVGAGIIAGGAAGVGTYKFITEAGEKAGKTVAAIVLTPSKPNTPAPAPPTPAPAQPMQAPDSEDGLGMAIVWNTNILAAKIRGVIGKRRGCIPLYDLPGFGPEGEPLQLGGLRGEEAFMRLILGSRGPRVNSGWDYGDRQVVGDIPRELLYEKIRQLVDPQPGG